MEFTFKAKNLRYLVLVLLLAACTPAAVAAPAAAPSATPTAFANPTEAATASATPTDLPLTADIAKETCLLAGGQMHIGELPSEILPKPMPLRVYTPPCYDEYPDQRYPVLYLIHGQTYNDDQWDRLGADEAADRLIAGGEVPLFIIVMPADTSHYTQPRDNSFDEAFVDELIPYIDSTYRTLADRQDRAVGGLSRGASWAIHLALTHPELFGALGGHSPPVFQEDAYSVRGWLAEIPRDRMPRIWLDIGESDQREILDSAVWFEGLLNDNDIPHQWSLFTGNHSETYWSRHVEMYLEWYAQEW